MLFILKDLLFLKRSLISVDQELVDALAVSRQRRVIYEEGMKHLNGGR